MKRLAAFAVTFTVLSIMVTLVGCSGTSNNGRTIRSGRGTGATGTGAQIGGVPGAANTASGPQLTTPNSTGQMGWGVITPSSNQATQAFLSTDFYQGQVGNTVAPCNIGSGLGGGPCVIKFAVTKLATPTYAPVQLTAGVLSQALASTTPVPTQDGYITIVVWDSISGTNPTNDPNFPQGYPPIVAVIPLSSRANPNTQGGYYSTVSSASAQTGLTTNAQVNLFFGDNEGNVLVAGNDNGASGQGYGDQLSGNIEYANLVTMQTGGSQTSGGTSGVWGTFQANLCDLLGPCQ